MEEGGSAAELVSLNLKTLNPEPRTRTLNPGGSDFSRSRVSYGVWLGVQALEAKKGGVEEGGGAAELVSRIQGFLSLFLRGFLSGFLRGFPKGFPKGFSKGFLKGFPKGFLMGVLTEVLMGFLMGVGGQALEAKKGGVEEGGGAAELVSRIQVSGLRLSVER